MNAPYPPTVGTARIEQGDLSLTPRDAIFTPDERMVDMIEASEAGRDARAVPPRRSWTALLAVAALLLGCALFGYGAFVSSNRTAAMTSEAGLVDDTQRLLTTLLSAESSERGFVLTGGEAFREPYDAGLAQVDAELAAIGTRFGETGADPAAFEALRQSVADQLRFAADVVEARQTQGFEAAAALVRSGEGRERMDRVRSEIAAIQEGVAARLALLSGERRSSAFWSSSGFGLALIAALALGLLALRRQREARRSRELLDAVLAHAPVSIGFLSGDGRPAPLSAGARSLDALALERPEVRAVLDGVRRSGRPALNVEVPGAGGDRHFLASMFPLRLDGRADADGLGIVAVDTTERVEAEARLLEAERRYRSLVETTAAIVWSAAGDGHFGDRQESWEAFTGQSEADYSGFGWAEAIHPEDRERSAAAWTHATTTTTPYSIEHRVRRRDGAWRNMLANAVPILEADGTVREWIGTHTDITEHKETAARLSETHSQFQALADNIPQMAWMARPDGSIFWYNRRWFEFTGTTLEEMRGFGWVAVHHPDHAERVRESYQGALAAGRPWEDTFPLRGADGAYRWFLSQALPIRDAEGTITRWFGTNTDVTRQREQERELASAKELAENANRAKSQFIANMSHELRTPLTAVIGYTEMLEEDAEESGAAHLLPDLGKIRGNARHLLSLINDVLDLSKIEAERMEVHAETFDVAGTVREIAATVGSLMEKKENRLELDLPPDLGSAHTDEVKLRQCLINLLSNAAKFTEKGTIRLKARRERQGGTEWLVFDVADEGIGMSDEQLAKLFQRFTQADASTTRKFGGTGLGLAITKAFCKLLGGDVAVTSREGEGSTFTVKIPATVAEGVPEAPASAPVPAEERARSAGVVLAIDDDPTARDLVSRFLTREGFLVRTAADGVAGLEMARLTRPDAILLDVTMPRMDGWTVLTALKADADLSRIPVIMLTVIDEHSLGYALGASDYLLKPVEWDQLRKVMDRFRAKADALVLAVDDDEDLLARMRTSLEREGFRVMTALNGREALAELDRETPDLILTDLVMPQMDGFAFIRAARKRAQTASTPIVVLTSKDLTRAEFRELRQETEEVIAKHEVALSELAEQLRVIVSPPEAGSPAGPDRPPHEDRTQ